MLTVKLLQTFLAVARHRHFGKAAQMLNMTQPGISQHIARLEGQLGVRLIQRSSRNITLTSAGILLVDHAKRLLAMIDRVEEEVRQHGNHQFDRVRIGLSSSALYSEIPKRIQRFSETNPQVQVNVTTLAEDGAAPRLDWDEVDAILTPNSIDSPEYVVAPVCFQRVGAAMNAQHVLAQQGRLTLGDLLTEKFILSTPDRDGGLYKLLRQRFAALGAELVVAHHEQSFGDVLARVALGQGVALVGLGYQGDADSPIRVVPLDDPVLSQIPVYIIARRDHLNASTRKLMVAMAGAVPV